MKLEQQVCSPNQGQKLMELGIKAPSNLHWYTGGTGNNVDVLLFGEPRGEMCYPAYTVAELGLMLPDLIETDKQYELVCIKEADDEWLCRYCRNNNMLDTFPQLANAAGKTEAEARANELIYLLEKNLTTPEDCNKRLQD